MQLGDVPFAVTECVQHIPAFTWSKYETVDHRVAKSITMLCGSKYTVHDMSSKDGSFVFAVHTVDGQIFRFLLLHDLLGDMVHFQFVMPERGPLATVSKYIHNVICVHGILALLQNPSESRVPLSVLDKLVCVAMAISAKLKSQDLALTVRYRALDCIRLTGADASSTALYVHRLAEYAESYGLFESAALMYSSIVALGHAILGWEDYLIIMNNAAIAWRRAANFTRAETLWIDFHRLSGGHRHDKWTEVKQLYLCAEQFDLLAALEFAVDRMWFTILGASTGNVSSFRAFLRSILSTLERRGIFFTVESAAMYKASAKRDAKNALLQLPSYDKCIVRCSRRPSSRESAIATSDHRIRQICKRVAHDACAAVLARARRDDEKSRMNGRCRVRIAYSARDARPDHTFKAKNRRRVSKNASSLRVVDTERRESEKKISIMKQHEHEQDLRDKEIHRRKQVEERRRYTRLAREIGGDAVFAPLY